MSIQLILPSSHRWHSSYPNIIRKVASSKPHRSMPYDGSSQVGSSTHITCRRKEETYRTFYKLISTYVSVTNKWQVLQTTPECIYLLHSLPTQFTKFLVSMAVIPLSSQAQSKSLSSIIYLFFFQNFYGCYNSVPISLISLLCYFMIA